MNIPTLFMTTSQSTSLFAATAGQQPIGTTSETQSMQRESPPIFSSLLADSERVLNTQQTIFAMPSHLSSTIFPSAQDTFTNEDERLIEFDLADVFQALDNFLEHHLPESVSTDAADASFQSINSPPPNHSSSNGSQLPIGQAIARTDLSQQTDLQLNALQLAPGTQFANQEVQPSAPLGSYTQTTDGTSLNSSTELQLSSSTAPAFSAHAPAAVSPDGRLGSPSQIPLDQVAGQLSQPAALQRPSTFKNAMHHSDMPHNQTLFTPLSDAQQINSLADHLLQNDASQYPATLQHGGVSAATVHVAGQLAEIKGLAASKSLKNIEPSGQQTEEVPLGNTSFNTGFLDAQNTTPESERSVASNAQRFLVLPPDKAASILGAPLSPNRLLLQIQPPELGHIQIEVQMANDQLTATLWAETSEVRSVLLNHLPALNQALIDQSLRPEVLTIAVSQEGFSDADSRPSQQQGSAQSMANETAPEDTEESMVHHHRAHNLLQHNTSLLNVIV